MSPSHVFARTSRLLHWLMAVLILAMLFIGVGMASTVSARYRFLIDIHRPIGIVILLLVCIRLINRLLHPPPPLPDSLPFIQRLAALGSHAVLYILMIAMPLLGWAMLSAAGYPVVLYGSFKLPAILAQNLPLAAALRRLHGALAYALFAVILLHVAAALFHGLIRRDGVFESMTAWRAPRYLAASRRRGEFNER
jgi:cytochrome b561